MIVASFFAPRFEKWPGVDYDALLMLLDASCRRLGLPHIVISDAERPAPLISSICSMPQNLMLAILDGQRQLLEVTDGPVLLVGADCLLTRDPRPFLLGDLAITLGPFTDCPMNTGAIWCRDGATCACVWRAALDLNPVDWGDDQRVLYRAVKASGLNVALLRCEDHNWAPDNVSDPAGMPTVVHFRGPRKAWMAAWAARHMGLRA